ncbi:unnamed protein product [Blepharisma stoltei]|uniref:Uncharacterized protein n=1 Tax=Blepharisma stoltei TaxID=1481888 RepID=A0AAU9JP68_9CILI|nr:unnamed protein product [Blepharisma stoltei]
MSRRHKSIDSKIQSQRHRTKKSLPPISHHLRDISDNSARATPCDKTPELSLYTYFNDKSFTSKEHTTAHKFFTHEPLSPASPSPDLLSRSVIIPTETPTPKILINPSLQLIGKTSKWEIMERIENYEIKRIQKVNPKRNFKNLSDEFYMWFQCYSEIVPLIKMQSEETAKAVSKINEYILSLFSEVTHQFRIQNKERKEEKLGLEKKLQECKAIIIKMQGDSEERMKESKIDEEKIKKEINEIFGEDDREYQLLKQKANRLNSVRGGATIDVLNEIYNDMMQEREIPSLRNYDNPILKPEDIEKNLMKNFRILQTNTARRVHKIFESKQTKLDNVTQTEETFIEPQKYDEANSKIERLEKQFHQLAYDYNAKIEEISSLNKEIKTLNFEKEDMKMILSRTQKEAEMMIEQVANIKKENLKLKTEVDEEKAELANRLAEKKNLEMRIEQQSKRIEKLVEKTEGYERLIKENGEKIKDLEEKNKGSQEKLNKEISKGLLSSKHTSTNNMSGSSNSIIIPQPGLENDEENQNIFQKSDSNSTIDFNARAISRLSMDTNCSQSTGVTQSVAKHQPRNSFLSKVDEMQPTPVNTKSTLKKHINKETDYANKSSKKSVLNNEESRLEEEELQLDKKWRESIIATIDSHNSTSPTSYLSDPYLRISKKARLGENGIPVQLFDEDSSTLELSIKNARENSKGIQYNWETPDIDYNDEKLYDSNGNIVYLVPFNPNNIYGLNGDNYHHTLKQIFQAQPKIPDLKDSVMFRPSYVLDKNEDMMVDKLRKKHKKKNKLAKQAIISPYLQ